MFCITHQSPFQVNAGIMGKLIKINSKLINILKTLGSNVQASCKGAELNSFILIKARFPDKFLLESKRKKKFLLEQQKRFCCLLKDVMLFQSNIIFPFEK